MVRRVSRDHIIIRNKVCTKILVSVLFLDFCVYVGGGHPVCTVIIFVYVLRIIIYAK